MCFSPDHVQALPHWLMSSDGMESGSALKCYLPCSIVWNTKWPTPFYTF